jgi:hypothetical protein
MPESLEHDEDAEHLKARIDASTRRLKRSLTRLGQSAVTATVGLLTLKNAMEPGSVPSVTPERRGKADAN